MLHIKGGGDPKYFALIFANAVKRFGSRVEQEDLDKAYKRPCRVFTGQLEQHFVLLKEVQGEMPGHSTQGSVPGAKKHPLEDQAKS